MSAFRWREINRWLHVLDSQLWRINSRLTDPLEPVELTTEGVAAFSFLVQSRQTLSWGSMVLEEEIRRALDLFMRHPNIAFKPGSPAPSCYQEVAEKYTLRPRESSSAETAGPTHRLESQWGRENEPGPLVGHVWDVQDVAGCGKIYIARYWYTHENGYIVWNGFVVDDNGIPHHSPPYIYHGHMRRLCVSDAWSWSGQTIV